MRVAAFLSTILLVGGVSLPSYGQTAQAFDVASVKQNKSDAAPSSNFHLGPGDFYTPNGGLFAATFSARDVYCFRLQRAGQSNPAANIATACLGDE